MYDVMNTIKYEQQEYIEDEIEKVFNYIFISAIQIKSGKIQDLWYDKSSKSGVVHFKGGDDPVFGYKFVDDYLLQCKFEDKEISEVIKSNAEQKNKEDEAKKKIAESAEEWIVEDVLQYEKLREWKKLEDEEINEIRLEILEELKQLKYPISYFKDIIYTFIILEDVGFAHIDFKEYIKCMIKKVETDTDKINCDDLEIIGIDQDLLEKYNEIVRPLLDAIDKKESKKKVEDNAFLVKRECWNDNFFMECSNRRQSYMLDKKFFYYIEPTEFISQLQKANLEQIANFMYGVCMIYNSSDTSFKLNEYFQLDIPNLQNIIQKINTEEMCNGKITRRLALENLLDELKDALQRIKSPVL